MSTTGTHNHPPHVKTSSGSKMDLPAEQSAGQTFAQPLSNQIQNLPSTSAAAPGMINQHQMSANMNFVGSVAPNNNNNNINNFSMTNILNAQLNEIDPSSLLTSSGLNQMDSNIQITPIINASIENVQMQHHHQQEQHQQQVQRNVMSGPNMHVEIAITSANN